MKILSLVSSYRKNGNTERLVNLIEEELQLIGKELNEPLEFERILLGHAGVHTCHGCRLCFDKGEEMCPIKDSTLEIRDKIVEANAIILASPVYVEDVNGIMKNWIDRMAFNCHCPAFAGKAAVIVTTSGGGSTNHALKTMKTALTTWGFYIDGCQNFQEGALMKTEDMKARYYHKIRRIANSLFIALKNEKALKPTFYSLIAFKIQQKYWQKNCNDKYSVDYAYWSNRGWLEPHCEFYTANKASWIKIKIARVLGSIISVFFI